MIFLADLLGMLAFRTPALQSRAERRSFLAGIVCFTLGFLAFVLVRNTVYAGLPEVASVQTGRLSGFLRLNLIQAVLFVSLIYVPVIVLLSKTISGKERGFWVTALEYRAHGSALLPLWGLLLLIAAPLQHFAPQFLVVGIVGVSAGMFALLVLLAAYTVWAVKQLNCLSVTQAVGAFCLSWFTLPVYYLIT